MAGTTAIVGIDLGTTNSALAYVGPDGRPAGITNFEGDVLTPSAVFFDGNTAFVGREAFKLSPRSPAHFAEAFKRHMGEGHYPRLLGGHKWRPEELAALVLRRLRNDLVRTFGAADAAVITVPAYFDEGRRRATQNAGAIAGWKVADIINEPTAAAIAYAHAAGQLGRGSARERVLIYDLGGGTFDTTLLEIRAGQEYRALATDGEVRLGGCDWDERLRQHLAEAFHNKTGVNPLTGPDGNEDVRGGAEFLRLARQAKHRLSSAEKVALPAAYRDKRVVLEVTRSTFEFLTRPLLDRTRVTTEALLDEAKLTWKEVDRVLTVGGATRMPMVDKMLAELTGTVPDHHLSVDEAVAHGAAVYAALKGQAGAPRVINVNAHDVRVVGRDGKGARLARTLLARNRPLPVARTKAIPVLKPGITEVVVPVCEGESEDPDLNEPVGEVRVSGIPADGRRWVVGVTLGLREDGTVEVEAAILDPDTPGRVVGRVNAALVSQRGMTPEQVVEARQRLDTLELN